MEVRCRVGRNARTAVRIRASFSPAAPYCVQSETRRSDLCPTAPMRTRSGRSGRTPPTREVILGSTPPPPPPLPFPPPPGGGDRADRACADPRGRRHGRRPARCDPYVPPRPGLPLEERRAPLPPLHALRGAASRRRAQAQPVGQSPPSRRQGRLQGAGTRRRRLRRRRSPDALGRRRLRMRGRLDAVLRRLDPRSRSRRRRAAVRGDRGLPGIGMRERSRVFRRRIQLQRPERRRGSRRRLRTPGRRRRSARSGLRSNRRIDSRRRAPAATPAIPSAGPPRAVRSGRLPGPGGSGRGRPPPR